MEKQAANFVVRYRCMGQMQQQGPFTETEANKHAAAMRLQKITVDVKNVYVVELDV